MGCEVLPEKYYSSIEYYKSLNQKNKVTTSPPSLNKPIEFEKMFLMSGTKSLYGVNTLYKKKRIKAVFQPATSGLRYYNPAQGKWLSRDPLGDFVDGDLNLLYGFCLNNPILYADKLGLKCTLRIRGGHYSENGPFVDRYNKRRKKKTKSQNCKSKLITVGCFPDNTNGKIDPDAQVEGVQGLFEVHLHSGGLMKKKNLHAALTTALNYAKKAAKKLLNKKPDCCKSMEIQIDCSSDATKWSRLCGHTETLE
jgi:RHS repeat-associated protein